MSLITLVNDLTAAGVTVPRGDDYRALFAADWPAQPAATKPLLDMTAAEFGQLAYEQAVRRVVTPRNGCGNTSQELRDQLTIEYRAVLASSADELVEQLRPAFDEAADAARRVRELGIGPLWTAERVMASGAEAGEAWLKFKNRHAATLDRVLGLRRAVSVELGVAPIHPANSRPDRIDWSVVVTRPAARELLADPREPSHVTWLKAARSLHLVLPGEISDHDALAAAGINTAVLDLEARRLLAIEQGDLAAIEETSAALASID